MRLQAPHCPGCGAPLNVPEGATRLACEYCSRVLLVDASSVRTTHAAVSSAEPAAPESYPEPDARLYTREAPRFELSAIEQLVEGSPPEVFTEVLLDRDRFALVSLRVVDADGQGVAAELGGAFAALRQSLQDDGDPGLAANLALEALCRKPFTHRLECAVLLFEPDHMRVSSYLAGARDAAVWASSEEGRGSIFNVRHPALDRKKLREANEPFSNSTPIHLAAHDLVVMASAGFSGRGARGYGNGARVLQETLDEHLGEEPLRVVTLAKNGFWADFQKNLHSRPRPTGDVKLVAVRAILPQLVTALPADLTAELHRSKQFEVGLLKGQGEQARLLPLHDERAVLVWLAGGSREQMDVVCQQVLAHLDRREWGDNENPRRAGRDALEALGPQAEQLQLALIQLFDRHGRVKYFRHGWKQPIALGERGVKGEGQQQFDEGGEATVNAGARLFFPGSLHYDGQHGSALSLATAWSGGKASRLYEAFTDHWKTRRTLSALEKLARAALSDQPGASLRGVALVTGLERP